jgi:putative permease
MTTSPQAAVNRAIVVILVAAVLCMAGFAIQHTVSSFLLSFVIAYLLDPVVAFLERRGTRRLHAIIFLYAVLGILSFFFLAYFIPFVTMRWESLLRDLPRYLQKGKEMALEWQGRMQPSRGGEEWRWLIDTATGSLDTVTGTAGSWFYAFAGKMAFNIFNLILAPILVFFMLIYKHEAIEGITSWIPLKWRPPVLALGTEINESIGGYIRGQLIVSIIVAVLSAAALFMLDVDYAVLNGIFAGLASILPFVGVILATIPPLFFALVKFQSGLMLFKVVAAFAVIYFLEGYLVKPLVFKKSMDLNPLVTIIVVMAFGELLGFWGILLAIPITAACKIVLLHLRRGDFAIQG